jgi:hypothetical protein
MLPKVAAWDDSKHFDKSMGNVANLLDIARCIAEVASKVTDEVIGRELMVLCERLLRELGLPGAPDEGQEPPTTRH